MTLCKTCGLYSDMHATVYTIKDSKMSNHIDRAKAYIESHGHEAFITPDGLLAKSWVVFDGRVSRYFDDQNDNAYEELEVFPIVDGMVSIKAIRNWLGY